MSIQFFGRGSRRAGLTIDLPKDYNTKLRWLPRIGDVFPDFSAESSHGPLRFRDWAAGSWVYLFSHPAAFTPVCTTELADVAAREEDFQDRGVKPLNLSRDTVAEQLGWVEDIAEIFDVRPTFPLVSDPHGTLASVCGMIHPKEDAAMCIRKAFILDPARRIRMIFEYPMRVGRSVEETLRVIDALQATSDEDLAAPGGWQPGEPLLVPADVPERAARRRYGARLRRLRHYLRFVEP